MSLNENIFLYSVPNFSKHKNKLIELIYEIPINGLYCNEQRIYHQDYNLPPGFTRSYYNYFVNNIYPNYHSEFCNINKTTISLEHTWFQIYKKMISTNGTFMANVILLIYFILIYQTKL